MQSHVMLLEKYTTFSDLTCAFFKGVCGGERCSWPVLQRSKADKLYGFGCASSLVFFCVICHVGILEAR